MSSLKDYVRRRLDAGQTLQAIWREAEKDRWHVAWNYLCKIKRDWERERAPENGETQ